MHAAPRDAFHSSRFTVITADRLLDVKAGVIRAKPVITLQNDRIADVRFGDPPSGAKVLNLGDVTILPGLIDCHTHIMSAIKDDSPDGYRQMLLTQSQAMRALEGANAALKTVRAGFTSVRDCENEGAVYADVALRDAIERGIAVGPRMLVSTRAIASVGQYFPFGVSPDLPSFPRGAQMVSGKEEARRAVREQIGNGADFIKVYADWGRPTLTREEIGVVVQEAKLAGVHVAAHATSIAGIRNAIACGVRSIEHGADADRATLELMKRRGVWLVPTLAAVDAALASDAPRRERARRMVREARDIGVKICAGYDASTSVEQGRNVRELFALARAGLTPIEAIRAATTEAARLLGRPKDVGSLEPGAFADIVAVKGDPLRDLQALAYVSAVLKGGVLVT